MSTEYPPSLAAALAQLQTRLPRITKSEKANTGSYSYTYAGLADISAQVLPLLGEVGLSFMALPTYDDNGRYVLVCSLMHVSGDTREALYPLPSGGSPQALGSAITYGRRYILCAMTGIAPDDDDDGAAAEAAAAAQPRTAQRSKPANARKAPSQSATRRARRPAPAEPPLPGEDDQAAPSVEPSAKPSTSTRGGTGPVTRTQLTKIHAQLGELGIADRGDKLATVGLLVRRSLGSSSEITKAEASKVIETLNRVLAADEPVNALDAVLAEAEAAMDAEPEGDAAE